MAAGYNEARLRPVNQGQTISARTWNEVLRLLRRNVTGPNVQETSSGWHIRGETFDDNTRIPVFNESGETAPAGAWIAPNANSFPNYLEVLRFSKPSVDNDETVYILIDELQDDSYGFAWQRGILSDAYFDVTPSAGDIVGSVAGEWYGRVDDNGTFVVVRATSVT